MPNLEEIENRMNQTKNILHKCALEGQINIGLMLSDIEYLVNENRTLKNVNEYLHKRLIEKVDKDIIDNHIPHIEKRGDK